MPHEVVDGPTRDHAFDLEPIGGDRRDGGRELGPCIILALEQFLTTHQRPPPSRCEDATSPPGAAAPLGCAWVCPPKTLGSWAQGIVHRWRNHSTARPSPGSSTANGDAEWSRHEASPSSRASFHIHRHYLQRFVRAGDRVLEVGAGSGRFTVELARLAARVTVTDISPEQLRLNEEHIAEADQEGAVEARHVADVLDLSRFEDRAFDATVCYGGPLSWVLEGADRALDELLRVTKIGGYVLLGVMSRFGTLRAFLAGAAEEIEEYGLQEMQDIVDTGYLPDNHSTLGPMHLYTWAELRALLDRHPCGNSSSPRRPTPSRSGTTRRVSAGSGTTRRCGNGSSPGRSSRAPNPGRSMAARTSSRSSRLAEPSPPSTASRRAAYAVCLMPPHTGDCPA